MHPRSPRLTVRAALMCLLVCLAPAGGPRRASAAQDDALLGAPLTPAPAECTVPSRSLRALVRLGGVTGIVVNIGGAEGLVASFGDTGRYEAFWHRTRRDIAAVETALPGFLASQSPSLAERVADEESPARTPASSGMGAPSSW